MGIAKVLVGFQSCRGASYDVNFAIRRDLSTRPTVGPHGNQRLETLFIPAPLLPLFSSSCFSSYK